MNGADADLKISEQKDWQMFSQKLLDVIVDPMVFRSAEIFLRGREDATKALRLGDPEKIWDALSGDLGSLTSFFDQIILAHRLPLIDYGITFDSRGVTFKSDRNSKVPWISRIVNQELEDHAVVTVHVCDDVSKRSREAALIALPERPPASVGLVEEVFRQLAAFDYQWCPNLAEDDVDLPAEKMQIVNQLQALPEKPLTFVRFLYAGLLFSAFSQMSGSAHLLQPKRWQLLTAASIGARSGTHENEEELVVELDSRIQKDPQYKNVELGSLPSFVPYLLSLEPRSPLDLLRAAKELRKDRKVVEYRGFRREILQTWIEHGRIKPEDETGVKHAAVEIHNKFKLDKKFEVGFEFGAKAGWEKDGFKGFALDGGIKVPVPISRIWGWLLQNLPGHRYIKVLTRLKLAEHQYPKFERHLQKVWSNS